MQLPCSLLLVQTNETALYTVCFGRMTNGSYVSCQKMKTVGIPSHMNGLLIFVSYRNHGKTRTGLLFHFPPSCLLSLRHETTLILRDIAKFHPGSPQEFVYEDGQKLSTNWKITPTFTRNKTSFLDPRSERGRNKGNLDELLLKNRQKTWRLLN